MLKAHSSFWLKSGLSVLSTYENQPWVFAQINNQCEHSSCGKPRSSFISGECIAHCGFGGCGSWALAGHPLLHYLDLVVLVSPKIIAEESGLWQGGGQECVIC